MIVHIGFVAPRLIPLRKPKNLAGRSDKVSCADHRVESVQVATLSGWHHHVVCALVSPLPDFGGTNERDDSGKRFVYQRQLCLALGPDLRAGVGQALSAPFEAD